MSRGQRKFILCRLGDESLSLQSPTLRQQKQIKAGFNLVGNVRINLNDSGNRNENNIKQKLPSF